MGPRFRGDDTRWVGEDVASQNRSVLRAKVLVAAPSVAFPRKREKES
jgi:hypothetical protein